MLILTLFLLRLVFHTAQPGGRLPESLYRLACDDSKVLLLGGDWIIAPKSRAPPRLFLHYREELGGKVGVEPA